MTRNEARKIIKTHTQTKYSNSVLLLLLRLVDLTYRKDKDNAEREIETTTNGLIRAAGVKHRQLVNILGQLKADEVLLDVQHTARHVSCRLNLEPLTKLEPYGERQKAEKKEQAADRAAKAREARENQRDYSRNQNLYHKTLGGMSHAMQPVHDALLQHVGTGNAGRPLTHKEQQAFARLNRAQYYRNKAANLAAAYERIRDEKGKDAAEQMIQTFIEENPGDPVAEEIKSAKGGSPAQADVGTAVRAQAQTVGEEVVRTGRRVDSAVGVDGSSGRISFVGS